MSSLHGIKSIKPLIISSSIEESCFINNEISNYLLNEEKYTLIGEGNSMISKYFEKMVLNRYDKKVLISIRGDKIYLSRVLFGGGDVIAEFDYIQYKTFKDTYNAMCDFLMTYK